MIIANMHQVTPGEIRFTIIDGDRATVRFIFVNDFHTPLDVAMRIADNLNHYANMKANNFPYDYDAESHVAGILADARQYGTD